MRAALKCLLFLCFIPIPAVLAQSSPPDADWPIYGGNAGGQRFSPHTQINTTNVSKLQVAWTFHTGAMQKKSTVSNPRANFEATPVLWNNKLFFDTPFDEIFAINAVSGKKVWSFDPQLDRDGSIYIVTSRGVALWHAKSQSGKPNSKEPCAQHRVFVATLDRRLIARDAETGS